MIMSDWNNLKYLRKKLNDFRCLLADTLFPWDKCLLCGGAAEAGEYLCDECGRRLSGYDRCPICGCFLTVSGSDDGDSRLCSYCRESGGSCIDEHYSALPYAEMCRRYLLDLKYAGKLQYAGPLARYLAECLLHHVPQTMAEEKFQRILGADLVVAVPLHSMRFEERGYNQSAVLAEIFSERLGVQYAPRVLQRHRETAVQHRLSAQERRRNTEGAFSPAKNGGKVRGKRVILLDDIITSGRTMENCAKVLKELGAAEIYGVTVASALL